MQSNLVASTRHVGEPPPDYSNFDFKTFTETFRGLVPAGDTGAQAASGVTCVDVPFTSKEGAYAVTGRLSSTLAVDLDLELRDATGRVLSESKSDTVNLLRFVIECSLCGNTGEGFTQRRKEKKN